MCLTSLKRLAKRPAAHAWRPIGSEPAASASWLPCASTEHAMPRAGLAAVRLGAARASSRAESCRPCKGDKITHKPKVRPAAWSAPGRSPACSGENSRRKFQNVVTDSSAPCRAEDTDLRLAELVRIILKEAHLAAAAPTQELGPAVDSPHQRDRSIHRQPACLAFRPAGKGMDAHSAGAAGFFTA